MKTLMKIPGQIAKLTDIVEKASGLEGKDQGAGDFIQDLIAGTAKDIDESIPYSSRWNRGVLTETAKWSKDGEVLDVDFDNSGEIVAIRDEDGFNVDVMLSDTDV